MGLVKPFAFLGSSAAGGIVTDQLIHYYTNTADSFQNPDSTTWADVGNSAQALDLTANVGTGFATTLGGYNAWLVESTS